MSRDRRKYFAWFGTVLIVALCLWPKNLMPTSETSSKNPPHADKVVHLAMFAVFGLLWMRVQPSSRSTAMFVFLAGVGLAIGTEVAQGLPLIARDPDPLDALADVAGTVVGIALVMGAGDTLGVDSEADEVS